MTNEEKLKHLKGRLERAYTAEQAALEMQSTSNSEGEQQAIASLSTISKLISDLESQIEKLENTINGAGGIATMYWGLDS